MKYLLLKQVESCKSHILKIDFVICQFLSMKSDLLNHLRAMISQNKIKKLLNLSHNLQKFFPKRRLQYLEDSNLAHLIMALTEK